MGTPFEAIIHAIQNISWAQLWAAAGSAFVFIIGATWRIASKSKRLDQSQDYVEKMATNDFPHMFHTLVNMDKNIAKMSGGDPVSFSELDAMKDKK